VARRALFSLQLKSPIGGRQPAPQIESETSLKIGNP
jgi:hypothetical protein